MKMMNTIIRITTSTIILTAILFTALVKIYSEGSVILKSDSVGNQLMDQNNETNRTPLIVTESELINAALEGDIKKMKLFISAGADINKPVGYAHHGAQTLLMKAASKGHNEIIKILLEAGADINAKDNVLFPDDQSIDGNTAFMYAVQGGHYDTVNLFIQLGVDVNQQNRTKWTPIKYAANDGYSDIVELLIKSGADVNLPTSSSPLEMAVWENHIDVVKILINAGADVNIGNGEALITACHYGNQDVVEILLKAGADVNLKDKDGRTAIGEAKKKGYDDIVAILKNAGAVE